MVTIVHYLIIGLISSAVAAVIFFALFHVRLRMAFVTIASSMARMQNKYRERRHILKSQLGHMNKICTGVSWHCKPEVNSPRLDYQTAQTADDFLTLMHKNFGKSIESIYLFGSRARGDFDRLSDMDIAIRFLPGFNIQRRTLFKLLCISFKLLVKHGIYAQIRILRKNLDYLNAIIAREGLILLEANRQG